MDENVFQPAASSLAIDVTLDERTAAMNPFARSASPISGPGLAKPISMTIDASSKRRIDAALEKNLETIVTQVRRTTTKPSELAQNDLHLFDSTKLAHPSREMTPDSISEDQPVNGFYPHHPAHSRSMIPPSTVDYLNPYAQLPWPPAVYPYAHPQHPGLYLPYPPLIPGSNTHPSFYPSYDPHLIEQHYNPQGLSAYYARPPHDPHPPLSGTTEDRAPLRSDHVELPTSPLVTLSLYPSSIDHREELSSSMLSLLPTVSLTLCSI